MIGRPTPCHRNRKAISRGHFFHSLYVTFTIMNSQATQSSILGVIQKGCCYRKIDVVQKEGPTHVLLIEYINLVDDEIKLVR